MFNLANSTSVSVLSSLSSVPSFQTTTKRRLVVSERENEGYSTRHKCVSLLKCVDQSISYSAHVVARLNQQNHWEVTIFSSLSPASGYLNGRLSLLVNDGEDIEERGFFLIRYSKV